MSVLLCSGGNRGVMVCSSGGYVSTLRLALVLTASPKNEVSTVESGHSLRNTEKCTKVPLR